jgi:hypothetical protein
LHFDGGFDIRDTCYDAAYRDQVTEFCAFDVSNCETGGLFLVCGGRQGFQVEVAIIRELGGGVLATGEGWREQVLVALSLFLIEKVALTTLGADDV